MAGMGAVVRSSSGRSALRIGGQRDDP